MFERGNDIIVRIDAGFDTAGVVVGGNVLVKTWTHWGK